MYRGERNKRRRSTGHRKQVIVNLLSSIPVVFNQVSQCIELVISKLWVSLCVG
jgi:hypothetical protein